MWQADPPLAVKPLPHRMWRRQKYGISIEFIYSKKNIRKVPLSNYLISQLLMTHFISHFPLLVPSPQSLLRLAIALAKAGFLISQFLNFLIF